MSKLSHYDAAGNARMVDVGAKQETRRTAKAHAFVKMSREVLAAKRMHEFALLELLLLQGAATEAEIREAFEAVQLPTDSSQVASAIDTLTLTGYAQADVNRYQAGIAERTGDAIRLTDEFSTAYAESAALCEAVGDLLKTGKQLTRDRYQTDLPFTPGMQYSRRDAARIVGWPRLFASTIYGYKTDQNTGVCTIFVTLHKSDEIAASTAYEDQLVDPSTMRWFSRSRRTLASKEVSLVVERLVEVHVFAKKDDSEGSDHYYLGRAVAHQAQETTMPSSDGQLLPVVKMLLKFDHPIKQGLFDYLGPEPAA